MKALRITACFTLRRALVPVLLFASGLATRAEPSGVIRGEVLDAATDRPLASRVYVSDSKGAWFFAESAAPEGTAVRYEKQNWVNRNSVEMHVTLSAHPFVVRVPPGKYTIVAERGKEYRTLRRNVEVKEEDAPVRVRLELERWADLAARGWYSGDTHVHRSVEELPNVMLAEDLNVSFPLVHWVTRAFAPPTAGDKSSRVPEKDLIPIDPTHVIATRNTEYEIFTVGGKQHTLGAVFALHHGKPFETGVPPVTDVAREAHGRGALLDLDKHDWPWSLALVPLMEIDLFELANNHVWRTEFAFRNWTTPAASYMGLPDGGKSGGERDWILYGLRTWYALLDCGYRLRPTAGTASGVHPVPLGFSRVYVKVDGKFTFEKWFGGLGEGRSFVTTGPMLLVTMNGRDPGAVFRPTGTGPEVYTVAGVALGAGSLGKIEIVVNGKVVRVLEPENRKSSSGALETSFEEPLKLEGSSWVAVRCFEDLQGGRVRFAHTGPFHVESPKAPLRPRREEVEFLVRRVRDEIERSKGVLPPAAIDEYQRALEAYEAKLDDAR
jgi:hypothetical protein